MSQTSRTGLCLTTTFGSSCSKKSSFTTVDPTNIYSGVNVGSLVPPGATTTITMPTSKPNLDDTDAGDPCVDPLEPYTISQPFPVVSYDMLQAQFTTLFSDLANPQKYEYLVNGIICATTIRFQKDSDMIVFRFELYNEDQNTFVLVCDIPVMVYVAIPTAANVYLPPTFRFVPEFGYGTDVVAYAMDILKNKYQVTVRPTHTYNLQLNQNNIITPQTIPVPSTYSISEVAVGNGFTLGTIPVALVPVLATSPESVNATVASPDATTYSQICRADVHMQFGRFVHVLWSVFRTLITDTASITNGPNNTLVFNTFQTVTQICSDDILSDLEAGKIGQVFTNYFRPVWVHKSTDLQTVAKLILQYQTQSATISAQLQAMQNTDPQYPVLQAQYTQLQATILSLQTLSANTIDNERLSLNYQDTCPGSISNPTTNSQTNINNGTFPNSNFALIYYTQMFGIGGTWTYNKDIDRFELTNIKLGHVEVSPLVPQKLHLIKEQIRTKLNALSDVVITGLATDTVLPSA